MSERPLEINEPRLPTRAESLWFWARATCFRLLRSWQNWRVGSALRLETAAINPEYALLEESRSALFTGGNPAEFALQAGKVHNLRVAVRAINGVGMKAGETFSFWAQVGRPVRRRGFVAGRELREGCIVPSIGGGLCQFSNALYDAALNAGLEIVERHAHSQRVPGSMAALGRDATVFWNYVDLRLRAPFDWQIEAWLTGSELIVRMHGRLPVDSPRSKTPERPSEPDVDRSAEVESCETCGVTSCFRHPSAMALVQRGVTAWLVDSWQPEHDRFVQQNRESTDWLFTPLDSGRWKFGPYRWSTQGFAQVLQAPLFVAKRSWRSRRLASQGAARQRPLLSFDEELANLYARRLPPEATHLVISQNLLGHLWRRGILGGRTFDVLMTRMPMAEIEAALDRASLAHPESRTLADFRAAPDLVRAETEALAHAQRWITSHRLIARLGGARAKLVEWNLPRRTKAPPGDWLVFPASTLGRKGAYELREVVRELGLGVRICGPIIEEPDFWKGIRTERSTDDWLAGALCVVLPAWVEHQPRRLLEAVAAGVPVIASAACGLEGVEGVTTMTAGDVRSLARVVEGFLSSV